MIELLGFVLLILVIVGIAYASYWVVTQQMYVFEVLLGNGWLFFGINIAGFILSAIALPIFTTRHEHDQVRVNVGGCIIPVALSAYLMLTHPNIAASLGFILSLVVVTIISRLFSWYAEGEGVLILAIIVSVASAVLAHFLAPTLLAKLIFAYVTGTLGVLIGADILHLSMIDRDGSWGSTLDIGGAGTKDGIWMTGLTAALIVVILGW